MRRNGPAAVLISNVASFMSPTSYFVAAFAVSTRRGGENAFLCGLRQRALRRHIELAGREAAGSALRRELDVSRVSPCWNFVVSSRSSRLRVFLRLPRIYISARIDRRVNN